MIKSFAIYTVAGALNKMIPLLVLPVLTKYLAPVEFGIWSIYQVLLTFVTPVVGMNSQANITRKIFKIPQPETAKLIGNLMAILSAMCCLFLLFFSIILFFTGDLFDIPKHWLQALPVFSFVTMVNQFNLTVLRNKDNPKLYGAYEIGVTVFNFAISLSLLLSKDFGWQSMALGRLLASFTFATVSLLHLKITGFFVFDFSYRVTKEVFCISLPLIPHAVGGIVIQLSDRLFIDSMYGKSHVGLYTIGYTFGSALLLLTDSFNKAWSPWLYRQLAVLDKFRRRKIIRFTYLYAVFVFVLAIALSIAARYMIDLFLDPAYGESKVYVLWVSMAMAVQGMYFMMFPYPVHVGKTKFLGIITGVTAVINLIGNYLLIKLYGPIGAAQSTLISYVVLFLSVWWYSNRIYPMPWFRFKSQQRHTDRTG